MTPGLKKFILYTLLVLFGLFCFITAYGYYRPAVVKYLREKYEARMNAELARQRAEIEMAYKNDTQGGKTPEETVDLFLTALRSGDLEKSAGYYEFSVREKALESLKKEFAENGNVSNSLSYFEDVREKGVKRCKESLEGCVLEYVYKVDSEQTVFLGNSKDVLIIPKGGERTKSVSLNKNKVTKVWKITQPI